MPMKYTRAEIVKMCEDAAREDITTFYTKGFVNYRVKVKGNPDLYYTELIAEFIINHIDKFEKMKCLDKEHCVKMYNLHHTGECNPMTDCLEARTAIDMYKKSRSGHDMKYVGEIIDYHVPIKTKMTRTAGKIDLLSVTDDAVYAITLKRDDCKDTMLKCVLEAYTHIKMVNKQKLKK